MPNGTPAYAASLKPFPDSAPPGPRHVTPDSAAIILHVRSSRYTASNPPADRIQYAQRPRNHRHAAWSNARAAAHATAAGRHTATAIVHTSTHPQRTANRVSAFV